MSLIEGAKNLLGRKPKAASSNQGFSALSHDDKLGALYREYRCEDPNGRLLLNRTWFRTALYFQGKQQVRWNDETGSLDYFDPMPGEDWYTENQFRRDVISNVSAMCKAELPPTSQPSSDKPDDIAASQSAQNAMEVIRDDTDYDRGVMLKNQNLCLFGNAFKYQSFVKDSQKYGTTIVPKFDYQDEELPGLYGCPSCGNTRDQNGDGRCDLCGTRMETIMQPEQVTSKVEAGEEEQENGRNVEIVTGPLEMYMRSKVSHGLGHQPYLFWVRRIDADIVKDSRPNIDDLAGAIAGSSGGSRMDTDLSQFYIDVLSTLSGGSYEGAYRTSGARSYREVEYAMCWIRPEAFRGDSELKKKYPKGVMFETCNGKYIPNSAVSQSMDDCWTHYVYIVNPYSAWGDGMVDALPVQDQINEINSLMVRYLRYAAVGKHIYDQDVILPEWISNNPDEAWIPGQRQVEKKLSESVFTIGPTPMSQDVPAWKASLYATMQDMTHAYDASQGKSLGANTPYSSYVFQAEQAAGWFLAMFKYNRASVIQSVRQQLDLFRDNVVEERVRKFKDNTGKWSFDKFMGAALGQGSFDITISDMEGVPKTKAEKAQGLELFTQLVPLMPTLSQKQRIHVLDLVGMPADANPDTLMSQKAYRDIEAIVKRGEEVVPNGFVLDIPVYVKTIKEYLAGEDGDDLAATQPEVYVKLFNLMITAMMQGQMQMAGMPPFEPPQGGNVPRGNMPQGQQGQTVEKAQAPVDEGNKVAQPPLPAGARQE